VRGAPSPPLRETLKVKEAPTQTNKELGSECVSVCVCGCACGHTKSGMQSCVCKGVGKVRQVLQVLQVCVCVLHVRHT
jgi:hypothetical protein